jgi:hypothetical protein
LPIESAIDTPVLQELEIVVKRIGDFAAGVRHRAERYDRVSCGLD